MGSTEQAAAFAAAAALGSGDATERRAAAQTLRDLARRRASLLNLREPLVAALDDRDDEVRAAVALALLTDAWRFSGLLPVIDDLEQRLAGPARGPALAAAVDAAGRLNDFGRGTALLVALLAEALPASAALLSRLAGQGADLTPVLDSLAAPLGDAPPPAGDAGAGLWLTALARADAARLAPHLGRLRRWAEAPGDDWRYDDVRYRATEQLVRAALARGDAASVRALAGSGFAAVREASADALAAAWCAGGDAELAAELLGAHVDDPAGGVRYAAIRGMARAAAAEVALPIDAAALWAALPRAQYLSTGWTYPLDTTAISDLRGESAAADLATVLARHARQRGDADVQARLLELTDPQVAAAVRAVLGGDGA